MHICLLCHFVVEVDDIKLNHQNGTVVCLRCYLKEVEADRVMAKTLRQQLSAAMEERI